MPRWLPLREKNFELYKMMRSAKTIIEGVIFRLDREGENYTFTDNARIASDMRDIERAISDTMDSLDEKQAWEYDWTPDEIERRNRERRR